MTNVRRTVLSLLLAEEERDGFANLLLSDAVIARAGEDAARLTALFYGTVERRLTLDYAIGTLASREPSSLTPHTRNLLRLGLYQIYFSHIPVHAAVDETVSLGEGRGERALVNAVLRRAASTPLPLPPEGRRARHMSVKHAFPLSTVRHFVALYGEEETEELLSAFNRVAPLTVTVNLLKTTPEELLALWEKHGIRAERTAYSSRSLRLAQSISPERLPGFAEGYFLVQDEASALCAEALDAREGETVIDVCSAPGGKILSAATAMGGDGRLYAFDLHESKLSLIRASGARLGVLPDTRAVDATVGEPTLFGCADRVICDVPCSGLGVLGKKPDLRYRERSETLAPLGLAILKASTRYLKAGGTLVYSTCTLSPDENEENVRRFLSENESFAPVDFAFGGDLCSRDGMLTLLPHRHGTDGFFIAKLKKIK